MPARLRRGPGQVVEPAEVRPQGLPVPDGAAELGPGVNRGLGVGHEGLAADGAGPAEEFALGQVDDLAAQRFLCSRSAGTVSGPESGLTDLRHSGIRPIEAILTEH